MRSPLGQPSTGALGRVYLARHFSGANSRSKISVFLSWRTSKASTSWETGLFVTMEFTGMVARTF
ncbi:unnamed protein product [Linum tenue]|uniref:Uncharacterized protein n=1 Tax=Linum tenue TaxID=586396 RepID=A0AAV0IB19_9ROSI|nr:unnamed protein product [Linum tenue]